MKPRVLRTTKILAVALTAAAGCAPAGAAGLAPESRRADAPVAVVPIAQSSADSPASGAAPPQAAAHAAPPSPTAPSSARDAATAAASSQRPPPPSFTTDPQLNALRDELENTDRRSALHEKRHFRPLCDDDGYPLVGNVLRKGPASPYPVSAFCADVRTRAER